MSVAYPYSVTVKFMEEYLESVLIARTKMFTARVTADQAAANYRAEVRKAYDAWSAQGTSLRKSAEKLGITEGALRDLLRPEGVSRRARAKKAGDKNAQNSQTQEIPTS